MSKTGKFLFWPGQIVATPGAIEAFNASGEPPFDFLMRHLTGDWGDLSESDKAENELSVREGFRILSAYRLSNGTRFWIITEADRSATTFLLPEEY
jgi:hypothetical protein